MASLEKMLGPEDHDEKPILSSFNSRQKLSAKVSKQVAPLFKSTDEAYVIGSKIKFVEQKYAEISLIKNPDQITKNKLIDLRNAHGALNRELIDLNNDFITKLQKLFKQEGIPSVIVKSVDESSAWRFFPTQDREVAGREVLTLKLDLNAPKSNNKAFNYYQRMKRVFGINETTVSLKANAEIVSRGFFLGTTGRLEIGPQGAKELLQQFINNTGKHETRHGMFAHKREKGIASIFHTQFNASPDGILLNPFQFYQNYMSAEELYTFSTDLQSLAQIFKGNSLTDLKEQATILAQIEDVNSGLIKVSQTQISVTEKMILSLKNSLAHPLTTPPPEVLVYPTGNFTMIFKDAFGRSTTANFVSEAEKHLFDNYQATDKALIEAAEVFTLKEIYATGVDAVDLEKRVELKQATPEEVRTIVGLYVKFMSSPESQALRDAKKLALRPAIVSAQERMEKLNKLATIQNGEAKKLEVMLKQKISPSQIETIKKQMFHTAKNVKERFSGFGLNSEK